MLSLIPSGFPSMTAQLPASELTDAHLPRSGQVVAGKYRIDGFIARGGMGAVLAATHQVTGRRMALKWVLPDAEQDAEATHRIVREARAAARIRHPNVVDVYDVGEHDGSLFLVMELLEGETLHARLKAAGALDVRTTLSLLIPALRAVDAAHASHVIHRDLKPSNIFLCRDSAGSEITPRVLDFGISKILPASGDGERSLTRTGAVLGTPHYMAHEQLTGDDADARADVYALGVILYQCLTGRLPFQESNYNALVLQIATATPVPVAKHAPHVPSALSAVVMRAMARAPGDRFSSVAALLAALLPFSTANAHAQTASHSQTVSAENLPARTTSRALRPWLIALAACVLAAVAAWASQQRSGGTKTAAPAPPSSASPITSAPVVSTPPPAPPVDRVELHAAPPLQSVASTPGPMSEPPRERARPRRRAGAQSEQAPRPAEAAAQPPATSPAKKPVPISHEQF
jgi:eukaryotic-like serine/threonine-protein kinase